MAQSGVTRKLLLLSPFPDVPQGRHYQTIVTDGRDWNNNLILAGLFTTARADVKN
jgi:hypothetical protein